MAWIQFSPFRIPFSRRVETFAVLCAAVFGFLGHVLGILTWIFLFFSRFWYISVIYATFVFLYDRNTPQQGGRRIGWVRRCFLWKYLASYFPASLIKTADLDPANNYIFGFHPHGIIGAGAYIAFGTEGTNFSQIFPGITPRLLTLKIMFCFPFFRDVMMSFGVCEVSKQSIQLICSKQDGGNAAIIVVGGAEESLEARPGSCSITLKDRKGFIRMAIITGAHLVPVYSFGENELFKQATNHPGTRLRKFQEWFKRWLTFSPLLFYGRGIFQYTFGFLPFRRRIVTVVGAPIPVVQKSNPSVQDVDRYHNLYIRRLTNLFNKYKREHSDYPDASLIIQ